MLPLSLKILLGEEFKLLHAWFTSKYLYSRWLKAILALEFIIMGRELSAETQEL